MALTRSKNKIVAGVIAGFAESIGIDPTVLRIMSLIGAVVLLILGYLFFSLIGFFGVLLSLIVIYFLLSIIMPEPTKIDERKIKKEPVRKEIKSKTTPSKLKSDLPISYAGLFQRFIALVIDYILIETIVILLSISFAFSVLKMPESTQLNKEPLTTIYFIMGFILFFLYFFIFEYFIGGTVAKKMLHIKVVDENGDKPEPAKILIREFIKTITVVIWPLLILSALFIALNAKKQSIHDVIAKTYVIRD